MRWGLLGYMLFGGCDDRGRRFDARTSVMKAVHTRLAVRAVMYGVAIAWPAFFLLRLRRFKGSMGAPEWIASCLFVIVAALGAAWIVTEGYRQRRAQSKLLTE